MRFEFIDGDTRVINIMVKDGWKIENTFPNPFPQPYFFALMVLNTGINEDKYDVDNVIAHVCRDEELNQWRNGA